MGNQIGVRLHCQGGDEFLCDSGCHILCYEQGAYAQLFGIAAHPVPTEDGVLTVAMCDPQKLSTLDELRTFLGFEIQIGRAHV